MNIQQRKPFQTNPNTQKKSFFRIRFFQLCPICKTAGRGRSLTSGESVAGRGAVGLRAEAPGARGSCSGWRSCRPGATSSRSCSWRALAGLVGGRNGRPSERAEAPDPPDAPDASRRGASESRLSPPDIVLPTPATRARQYRPRAEESDSVVCRGSVLASARHFSCHLTFGR